MPLASKSFRFGSFQLDARAAELHTNGTKIKLGEQPFQVLCALLEHPGEVVTREELRQRLWPADTFVDFDHSLNAAVKRLRDVLGDSAEHPSFIETLPRHGYRFVAPIEKSIGEASEANGRTKSLFKTVPPKRLAIGLSLLGVIAVSIWLIFRKPSLHPSPSGEPVPVAVYRGDAYHPALSPNGERVVFCVEHEGEYGIYTALVGGENSVRLTTHAEDAWPAWSPDGRQIAFYRFSGETLGIYTLPALGGTEHRIYEGPANTWPYAGLSWSPDGEIIAFTEHSKDKIHSRISLLSLGDFSTRPLTFPDKDYQDIYPTYSPDGSHIAFQRASISGAASSDIYIVPAIGGDPKAVTSDHRDKGGLAWTADGREIVFSYWLDPVESGSLWRVPASGGTATAIAGIGAGAEYVSIAKQGRRLVYQHVFTRQNIWRLDLRDTKHRRSPPVLLVSEQAHKMRPHFSPDGTRIAFESDRLGYWEIWRCDASGSGCAQLTSLHGLAGAPQWSPDGRYIAFEFHPADLGEIYLLDVATGHARLLPTNSGWYNLAPSWSRDGKWLYFGSTREAAPLRFQLWKVPIAGGPPVQVTKKGGLQAFESADGRVVYHTKYDVPGIWKVPVGGGQESLVVADFPSFNYRDWVVCEKGIYFIGFKTHPQGTIQFFDFSSGTLSPLWDLEKRAAWGLTLSPDGHSVLYVQNDFNESNIMLLENFY